MKNIKVCWSDGKKRKKSGNKEAKNGSVSIVNCSSRQPVSEPILRASRTFNLSASSPVIGVDVLLAKIQKSTIRMLPRLSVPVARNNDQCNILKTALSSACRVFYTYNSKWKCARSVGSM